VVMGYEQIVVFKFLCYVGAPQSDTFWKFFGECVQISLLCKHRKVIHFGSFLENVFKFLCYGSTAKWYILEVFLGEFARQSIQWEVLWHLDWWYVDLLRNKKISLGIYTYTIHFGNVCISSLVNMFCKEDFGNTFHNLFWERLNETHFQNLQISTIVYN